MTVRGRQPADRSGIALVEAVLSMIVIGIMLITSLRLVVAARTGQVETAERLTALHLAAELMAEIIDQPYLDPDELPLFGPELSEQGATRRDVFDDVDDYHGWTESPPQDPDGTVRSHLDGWRRSVTVTWVDPSNPNTDSLIDLGAKRIVVDVSRNDRRLATVTAVRTAAVAR
jgi:hypothetical protein